MGTRYTKSGFVNQNITEDRKSSIIEEHLITHVFQCLTLGREAILKVRSILAVLTHGHKTGYIAAGAFAVIISSIIEGVFCSIRYQNDFQKGIITAVNHDGDSDSTGLIAGNILGAYLGINAIPNEWQQKVELRDVIEQVSDNLLLERFDGEEVWEGWPGY